MKLDTLYKILTISTEGGKEDVLAEVSLNSSHSVFEGHFPGNPVLPGVCVVHIIKHIVSAFAGEKQKLLKAHTIKFQNPINPLENNLIGFSFKNRFEAETIEVSVQVFFDNKTFCSFKGVFAKE